MAEYGEWNRKGATLSEVTAQSEYGVSSEFIIKGIKTGKLEYRDGAIWGNPYLRLLRSQLEAYIVVELGEDFLKRTKNQAELRSVKKEINSLNKKLISLQVRQVEPHSVYLSPVERKAQMPFIKEYSSVYKTALSDLQGAWQILRDEVVKHHPFQDSDRLLFQIDEAMSWEAVRDLEYMRKTLLIIRNIAVHAKAPSEVIESIGYVLQNMEEVFEAIAEGKIS